MSNSLLFLPGTMCTEELWEDCLTYFQSEYAFQSAAIYQAHNKAEMHEIIAAELQEQTHIVGFSLGAYLALEHMLKFPAQSVKSLILIAGSARGLLPDEIKARETTLKWIDKNAYKGINDTRLAQLLSKNALSDENVVSKIKAMDAALGKEVLVTQFQATTYREDLLDKLAQINVPVLLVGAENDAIVPVDALQKMANLIPNATLVVAPECGHMLPIEQPKWLAEQIEQWIKA